MSFSSTQQHILNRLKRRYNLNELGRFGIHDTVANWAARVGDNNHQGVTPSIESQLYLTEFWVGAIADGWSSNIFMMNCFAPDSVPAMITPLIPGNTAFNDPWLVRGIPSWSVNASIARSVSGWTGNASAFFDTGIRNSFGLNKFTCGFAWYCAALGTTQGVDLGSYDTSTTGSIMEGTTKYTDGFTYSYNGNTSPPSAAYNQVKVTSPGPGFYADNRVSSTDHRLYFATSTTPFAQLGATDTLTMTASFSGPFNVYVGATDWQGTTQSTNNHTLSFVVYYQNMTSTDIQNMFNRVQTLRKRWGGGWV